MGTGRPAVLGSPSARTLGCTGGHRTPPSSLSDVGSQKRQFRRAKTTWWGAGICPCVTVGVTEVPCPKSQATCVCVPGEAVSARLCTSPPACWGQTSQGRGFTRPL